MTKITNLWCDLVPVHENIELIKQDIKEGRVPELPYFIVNMESQKSQLTGYINNMFTSFQYSVLLATYGNGKSSVLKYLKAFFKTYDTYNVNVIYTRADSDKYDIILFLLKLIQDNCADKLISVIKSINTSQFDIGSLCNNYEDAFAAIKEYTIALKNAEDDKDILKLIHLGSGRLYTKNSFKEYQLEQLSDFNRREVLVLFLQLLNHGEYHIIFAIDEIEKIRERSAVRFGHYLTSFRELIDLGSHIKGHMVITASTDAGQGAHALSAINPAFARRIDGRIIQMATIKKTTDICLLANKLAVLLDVEERKKGEFLKFAKKASTDPDIVRNSEIVKYLCAQLSTSTTTLVQTLDEMLDNYGLNDIFKSVRSKLELDGAFSRLDQKFFDPLRQYLETINTINYKIKQQQYQSYIDIELKTVQMFLFTSEFGTNISRVKNMITEYSDYKFILYTPEELDITLGSLQGRIENVEIITYNPIDLMTLLVMYKDENLEHDDSIREIIANYTNNNL